MANARDDTWSVELEDILDLPELGNFQIKDSQSMNSTSHKAAQNVLQQNIEILTANIELKREILNLKKENLGLKQKLLESTDQTKNLNQHIEFLTAELNKAKQEIAPSKRLGFECLKTMVEIAKRKDLPDSVKNNLYENPMMKQFILFKNKCQNKIVKRNADSALQNQSGQPELKKN